MNYAYRTWVLIIRNWKIIFHWGVQVHLISEKGRVACNFSWCILELSDEPFLKRRMCPSDQQKFYIWIWDAIKAYTHEYAFSTCVCVLGASHFQLLADTFILLSQKYKGIYQCSPYIRFNWVPWIFVSRRLRLLSWCQKHKI